MRNLVFSIRKSPGLRKNHSILTYKKHKNRRNSGFCLYSIRKSPGISKNHPLNTYQINKNPHSMRFLIKFINLSLYEIEIYIIKNTKTAEIVDFVLFRISSLYEIENITQYSSQKIQKLTFYAEFAI